MAPEGADVDFSRHTTDKLDGTRSLRLKSGNCTFPAAVDSAGFGASQPDAFRADAVPADPADRLDGLDAFGILIDRPKVTRPAIRENRDLSDPAPTMPMMTAHSNAADLAHDLWAKTRHGVLATQSLAHPGYPFGSVVPYALGSDGQPLLLLSPLSQHTKNIDQNPGCSLTVMDHGTGDVQQRARLTALGDVAPVDDPPDAARYFRFFPQARTYHAELGFRFYRLAVFRLHWNGGFATARWLGADRVIRANPLDARTEARVVDHMNRDHRAALRRYLESAGIPSGAAERSVEMLGIDGAGIDLRYDGRSIRIPLKRSIASATEAREVLVEMAGYET